MKTISELEVMADKEMVNLVRELAYYEFAIVEDYEERWNSLTVKYNPRLRSTLGRFYGSKKDGCTVEINPECPESEIRDTMRHELLHLLTGRSDTKRFEYICNKLEIGFQHNIELEKAESYKFEIKCSECGEIVGKRMRKSKLIKRPENYRSGCCKAELIVNKL
jgi:predicted SprT family Zn-dependent metalloprotease